jgi:hypothetical protein
MQFRDGRMCEVGPARGEAGSDVGSRSRTGRGRVRSVPSSSLVVITVAEESTVVRGIGGVSRKALSLSPGSDERRNFCACSRSLFVSHR